MSPDTDPTTGDEATGDEVTKVRESLAPKDHAEALAIFRAQVIGPLLTREYINHGDLAEALRAVCGERYRPPGRDTSRHYSMSTVERWYYRFRHGGLEALKPQPRSDRGYAQALPDPTRKLLLAIREERPEASARLILRTLIADGRLERGLVSESTVRRLFAEEGLDRQSLAAGEQGKVRRRWEVERCDAIWHADVCHGPALKIKGYSVPLRIHGLLDDKSRYVPAIQACSTEREIEMLMLLIKAIRRRRRVPDMLYLDNGSTYIGDALLTACTRLGIVLRHARPHDPQARGKMERFWRTLRDGCLSHLGEMSSLHDVQVRLIAFLDQHYHVSPHASLLGKSPAQVYEQDAPEEPCELTETKLRDALTVRGRRRVRRDGTLDIGGACFETSVGFLAGRVVSIARSLLDPTADPWIEHEDDQRFPLRRVDPVANGRRLHAAESHTPKRGLDTPFDPPGALLDAMLGRNKRGAT